MEDAIFDKGIKGQMVVLDGVTLSSNDPLFEYEQPAFFIISDIVYTSDVSRDSKYLAYVLVDNTGKEFRVMNRDHGWWLVDINKWSKNMIRNYSEKLNVKDKEIEILKNKLEILKEVLVAQGARILTKKQAQEIGFEELD